MMLAKALNYTDARDVRNASAKEARLLPTGRSTDAGPCAERGRRTGRHHGQHYERVSEVPFSSETKWMAVQCAERGVPASQAYYYAKGATEVFLARALTFCLPNGGAATLTDDVRRQYADAAREVRSPPSPQRRVVRSVATRTVTSGRGCEGVHAMCVCVWGGAGRGAIHRWRSKACVCWRWPWADRPRR